MLNHPRTQSLRIMAHVQEGPSSSSSPAATQTCRRLRPRGRQRSLAGHSCWRTGAALFCLLAVVLQLADLVSGAGDNATNAPSPPPPAKDNAASVGPSWQRRRPVSNNEQELINKILRDDTYSSAPTSFQYTPLPTPAEAKSDIVAAPAPSSSGKINQSRSPEEQQAFHHRGSPANVSGFVGERRKRRAANVVVNTFSKEEDGEEQQPQSMGSRNSFFLLKSIVTGTGDCVRNKCSNNSRALGPGDIPQLLLRNSSDAHVHVLNLSDAGLRSLPHRTMAAIADRLPNVKFVDVSMNHLKAANLTLSSPLVFLNLSQNQLMRFQLHSNASLEFLDLSHNNLTAPPAKSESDSSRHPSSLVLGDTSSGCANVTVLDLSHNRLASLSFLQHSAAHCQWRVLNIAHNKLQRIKRDTFSKTPHLEVLSMAHNLVAEIENDTFTHLQHLQYLDLSDNLLNGSSVRALQGIPDLIGLSLARNPRLGVALQGFVASWSLKELDVSGTGLCEIPAALAQSVRTLNLAHNNFQVIRSGDLDSYPLLFDLDLSSCRVAEMEDDALGRLEMLATLNLNHNQLQQVPVSLPNNLVVLHLEHNRIMDLQASRFAHLSNLRVLSLSGNKIQYLPALPLRKLLVLHLVSAELHGLSQLVVQTSPHLKDLRLDDNPVKCADLLGIAEWATPCRDVGAVTGSSASVSFTDFSDDLDDEELRELAVEKERDNLRYLLDYVASKGGGGGDGEHSSQLLASSDSCRSSQTAPTSSANHLNGTKSIPATPPNGTLAGNKSPEEGKEVLQLKRSSDSGETEQIANNLPNPRIQQTVTVPPSSMLKTLLDSAKNSGKRAEEEPIRLMKQNNAAPSSLQITGNLNSNKRNGASDDATTVNGRPTDDGHHPHANEILQPRGDSSSTPHSISSATTAAKNGTAVGKSSESVAIKLAHNKSANIEAGQKTSQSQRVTDKKPLDRVNNKKLIKLTDSSNKRKLMPFIGETGQQRRGISRDTHSRDFAQQSIIPPSTSPPPPPATTTDPQPQQSSTSTIPDGSAATSTPTAAAAAASSLITMSAVEKSLPISSEQIIFHRVPEITPPTPVDARPVHNLLSPQEDSSTSSTFSTTTAAATANVQPSSSGEAVNEAEEMSKKLPKTVPVGPATSVPPPPRAPEEKEAANGELMAQTEGLLIEDTSSEDDNDNPLLKLWQQSSTHLSSHITSTTATATSTIPRVAAAAEDFTPANTQHEQPGDVVNEGKNLIRTDGVGGGTGAGKKATITRSHAAGAAPEDGGTFSSLKSETILINDRNNDGAEPAAADNFRRVDTEDSSHGNVLKLNSQNGRTFAAAAAASSGVAERHDQPPNSDNNDHLKSDSATNRRHPNKLSRPNTNSIRAAEPEQGDEPEDRRAPWNEHIKEAADSDNYHHRQAPHPGLFIVIGATIGIVLSIGLFRCKQSCGWAHRHLPLPDTHHQMDRHTTGRPPTGDYHQQRLTTSRGSSPAFSSNGNSRCIGTAAAAAAAAGEFVDVQLTPRAERKSVKFDLLPMKILSPTDHQPLHPIMTSDCDYAMERQQRQHNTSGSDMGAGFVADRGNKSSSPLELW